MVVEDFDPYEGPDDGRPVARNALTCGLLYDAQQAFDLWRAEWPVSGDASTRAGSIVHRTRGPFYLMRPPLRAVAGGWLQRAPEAGAEGATRLRCEDCPWGLDVQGWDDRAEVAGRLALRHTETRGHTVTAAEVKA